MNHTPGPWKYTGRSRDAEIVAEDGERLIAKVMGAPEIAEANSKLIEAAPDLLKALKPFAEYLKHPTQPILAVIRPEEWDAVTKAVAKAEKKEV